MTETLTTSLANDALPPVFEGLTMPAGQINVDDEALLANINHAIRLGYPQVHRQAAKPDRVALVGSGPSLNETFEELRDLVFEGAKLVTVNGAYHWCLERNLQPNAHIVLDARATNARFVEPAIPRCRYYLASQCHPDTWAAVKGREFVGIFHALGGDGPIKDVLDAFYMGRYHAVMGGCTVTTRAIGVLRMLGYLRFDLFGVDSCWLGNQHHAFDQPENQKDKRFKFTVSMKEQPQRAEVFYCAPWMVKQAEDLLHMIRHNGQHFALNVHGRGLIAAMLRMASDLDITIEPESAAIERPHIKE